MRRILLSAVLLAVTGCTTIQPLGRKAIDPPFWDGAKRNVVVSIGYVGLGEAARGDWFYALVATNPADAGKTAAYAPAFADVLAAAVELFDARGFAAEVVDAPRWSDKDFDRFRSADGMMDRLLSAREQLSAWRQASSAGTTRPVAEAMLRNLTAALQAERERAHADDLELVISMPYWGFFRRYTDTQPIGTPAAYFEMRADLFDLGSPALFWTTSVSQDVPVTAEWDEPPDFAQLRAALDQGFREAAGALLDELGTWDGKSMEFPPDMETKTNAVRKGE